MAHQLPHVSTDVLLKELEKRLRGKRRRARRSKGRGPIFDELLMNFERRKRPRKQKPGKQAARFAKTQFGPAPFKSIFNGIKAPKKHSMVGGAFGAPDVGRHAPMQGSRITSGDITGSPPFIAEMEEAY